MRNAENPIATPLPATLLSRSRLSMKAPQSTIAIATRKRLRKLCILDPSRAGHPHA
jgi:hypothetical protein